jgi:hypothetical protein
MFFSALKPEEYVFERFATEMMAAIEWSPAHSE